MAPDYRHLHTDLGRVDLSRIGAREPGEKELSALLALEHNYVLSVEPRSFSAEAVEVGAHSVALSGRFRLSRITVALDGILREGRHALIGPFPEANVALNTVDVQLDPEILVGGSVGLDLSSVGVRLALVGSVGLPASTQPTPDAGVHVGQRQGVVVFHPNGERTILPAGEERGLDVVVGGVGLVELGPMLSVGASLAGRANGNETTRAVSVAPAERVTTWGMPFRLEALGSLTAQLHF